jgi:imidazolonepropionase-like amidohydrolase
VIYPFAAYGNETLPEEVNLVFRNATVWTLEGEGKMENADVWVQNGKIRAVGKDLIAEGATEVDATGKHITPGIIDEHSHIALSGVNEGSHAVTAEVRMYDAVDSEDVDIYRQLSGGVTAAQLLHGSANPVGGQSALVKFRWGSTPEAMRIENADGYIKFALGENVKQSNWGDNVNIRFPQTRMGVEQVYMDAFTRAQEYGAAWKGYEQLGRREKQSATPPRRDLQLDALLEIINSERFITCHSYVQSEINMLMKVAEQFDFRVNTFTHILEGYKVADKMAEHGAGGSTFSDWWAYKYEVREAIPYNAVLMHQAGVTVAINSDDAEMARRLNQEAAKVVKYGGMDEIEALKTVTLNPARLLHVDDRMGSLKVGKDGDVVVWSDHPLSIYARAEMTLIDGKVYFDAEKDREMRENIRAERARLIAKLKGAKKNGATTQRYQKKSKHRWDCEEFVIENE